MQRQLNLLTIAFFSLLLSACIGDDVIFDRVEEQVRIMNTIDTLGFGESYQFEATFLNNVGIEETATVEWSSSAPEIVSIDATGLATALATGKASIYAIVNLSAGVVSDTIDVVVGENTVVAEITRTGKVETTTFYDLEGTFIVEETDDGIRIAFEEDYVASEGLPGLYIYLTNNPSSVSGAHEIGKVEVFNGEHFYEVAGVGINDYDYIYYWCKPFGVEVGEGRIE
ncbi:MAG: Ig-like domain-containing protein [Bacteroidota bacterium]